jgi:uncharacterized protein YpmB
MVKIVNAVIIVVVVLVLLIVGIAVYEMGIKPTPSNGTNTTAIPSLAPAGNDNMTTSSLPISAFQAVEISGKNNTVAGWSNNAYVTDITSEICAQGLSEMWIITYNVGNQQAYVRVSNGVVSDINTTSGAIQSPKVTTTGLIDSDKASSIAANVILSADQVTTGPISMEIMAGEQNTPIWDVIYKVQDGYYLVRLNATDGNVTGSTELSNG